MSRPPILSVALPSDTGRVLSIQSQTVQGYAGNKSAVFPLQLLGFDVDPINSVQFTNHTGYPTFRGQVLNGNQLWDLIEGLEQNDLLHYTHLLTGYIGSVSFLNTVLQVVDKLRSVNPHLIYVCDPVLGDEGKLYVPQELISVYQQKFKPRMDKEKDPMSGIMDLMKNMYEEGDEDMKHTIAKAWSDARSGKTSDSMRGLP